MRVERVLRPRWRGLTPIALLAVPVSIALALTVAALHDREGPSQFEFAQRHLTPVAAPALESVVRLARGIGNTSTPQVSCRALGGGELRNPWRCTLNYGPGESLAFRVTIRGDGAYAGSGIDTQPGRIAGCCVGIGAG